MFGLNLTRTVSKFLSMIRVPNFSHWVRLVLMPIKRLISEYVQTFSFFAIDNNR